MSSVLVVTTEPSPSRPAPVWMEPLHRSCDPVFTDRLRKKQLMEQYELQETSSVYYT